MSTINRTGRRAVRQELRSSRAGTAITVASLALCLIVYLATEVALGMLGQPPLLASPGALALGVANVGRLDQPLLYTLGAVLAFLGIILIARSLLPGGHGLHHMQGTLNPTVMDDTVVAAALAKTIRDAANLRDEQIVVSVGRRTAIAHVRPTTGRPVDRGALQAEAQRTADSYALKPAVRVRLDVDEKGLVG